MTEKNTANALAKECIVTALQKLMKVKPYEEISISEITAKAGVSRMAYYRNYSSKTDIIQKTLEEYAKKTDQYTVPLFESGNITGYLGYLFKDFQNVADFYINIQHAQLGDMILKYFNRCTIRFVSRYTNPEPLKYQILAFSGAIYNMAITWIMNDMKESPIEMAEIYLESMDANLLFELYSLKKHASDTNVFYKENVKHSKDT